jgi:hypothetical protein
MLLRKEDREERAIGIFLEYYNQVNGTCYTIKEWLDRPPPIQGHVPDCLCVDTVSGTELVIERTMLTGERDLKLEHGAEKFLADVGNQLACKLPGVFFLHDWGINAIRFKGERNREQKIAELRQAILKIAPTLAEGEEASLRQPFPVKLKKVEAHKMKTNCALYWSPPQAVYAPNKNRLDKQFMRVLEEANGKFTSCSDKETVLLINIWETGLDYHIFKTELLESVEMGKYPNIKHIYISEGLPDPLIYHLWSR